METRISSLVVMLILLPVILTSGCVKGGSSSRLYSMNDGIIIRDFSFDLPTVYDDEMTTLSLTIQNVGARKVPGDVSIFIYNQPMTTDENERGKWRVLTTGDFQLTRDGYLALTLDSDMLLPPDPEMNVEGDVRMFFIDLEPPNIPDGMSEEATFMARVCYPYNTSGIAYFTAISRNEIRYSNVKQSEIETKNSAGPVHIRVVGSEKVRAEMSRVPIQIEVINVGGGFPTLPSEGCDINLDYRKRNMVKVKVEVDGEDITSTCTNGGIIRLRAGGKGVVRCYYTMKGSAPSLTHRVVVTAYYKYYVDRTTTILVKDSSTD